MNSSPPPPPPAVSTAVESLDADTKTRLAGLTANLAGQLADQGLDIQAASMASDQKQRLISTVLAAEDGGEVLSSLLAGLDHKGLATVSAHLSALPKETQDLIGSAAAFLPTPGDDVSVESAAVAARVDLPAFLRAMSNADHDQLRALLMVWGNS